MALRPPSRKSISATIPPSFRRVCAHLARDEVERENSWVTQTEFREASFEAVVDDHFVLTRHGATINEHEFACHTVLIRLVWVACWNIIVANIELWFDYDRGRPVGLIRHRATRRRGHT